jgi:hypothetical protein
VGVHRAHGRARADRGRARRGAERELRRQGLRAALPILYTGEGGASRTRAFSIRAR